MFKIEQIPGTEIWYLYLSSAEIDGAKLIYSKI